MILVTQSNELLWEYLKSELIAVHCDTEEKAMDFCEAAEKHGYTWGISSDAKNAFLDYREELCFSTYNDSKGVHFQMAPCSYYNEMNRTIVDFYDVFGDLPVIDQSDYENILFEM